MRILILGGNLAGLLSALQLHRHGDKVSVLVHEQEAAENHTAPMVLTDPGPLVSRQSAWVTLGALANSRGDFRLGQGFMAHLPWLMRWLSHHDHIRAIGQPTRALALARWSKQHCDALCAASLLFAAEPLRQIDVYERSQAAKAHHKRATLWHMGSCRPSLSSLSDQADELPALDLSWARQKPTLTSGGMMVSNSATVVASLRSHLSQIGVRFIHDRSIKDIEHIGHHLHGVTLCGVQNQVEELDTDLVVAASMPAAWPLLNVLGLTPDLALLKTLSLRAELPDSLTKPILLHERSSGIRLLRHGSTVWARGPTWLGELGSTPASEVAQLLGRMTHYFGPKCRLVGEVPLTQTSWVASDGLPIVKRTTTRNLFLNIGHHSATASMAFGSATQLQTLIDQALSIRRSTPLPPRLSLAHGSSPAHTQGQIHA